MCEWPILALYVPSGPLTGEQCLFSPIFCKRLDCTVKNGPGLLLGLFFFSHHSTIFPQQIGLCLPLSLHQQNNIYPEAIGSQFVLSPMLRSHNSNVSSPTWLPLCALCSQFMQYAAALGKLAWLSFEDPFRIPHLALRC